ncbi:methionyl aminopeptidase [Chlamydiifrater phoenicopteri]|uniref:methionyl aminopeptidase n=1 Tax=Chlamydiifrater phoenicopteri TaxID=2681469 RepID=UPI001BD003ED|nr:methionyl aminopeptidase [Chlamydiifrater phoenicopteri]
MNRNDPCWCGSKKKWKHCHYPNKQIQDKTLSIASQYRSKYGILIKNDYEIKQIRNACQVTAHILNELCLAAKEGTTTNELDELSQKLHKEFSAIPAPLNYGHPPFPKTICTSLNEVICHGIPNDTPLRKGDILNIDVSCIVDGFFGDCSRMVIIDPVPEEKKLVCEASLKCLEQAINILKPEIPVHAIGDVIEDVAAEYGFSVVDQFVGHGVGIQFHEEPYIPHHRNNCSIPLAPGMTFTIEPMINIGNKKGFIDPKNHWEARTVDGKPSAQWEHTLLITEEGCEILTLLRE